MKLLLENWRSYLNERVYGNLITVYSRTTSEDAISGIASDGWKTGDYGDYGSAIYMVYGFEPNDYADRTYGTHVMKFALRANNKLLILGDKEAMNKVFGKELTIEQQLKIIAPEALKDASIAKWAAAVQGNGGGNTPVEKLKNYINGILLQTRKDGHIAVIYNPDGVLTMLSWAKIPKDYKFKSDEEARGDMADEQFLFMDDISSEVSDRYLDGGGWDEVETIEQIIKIIQDKDGVPEGKLSDQFDVANYLVKDEPVYRMNRTSSHEKDYSDVKYDKDSLEWSKEIKGTSLPQGIRLL